MGELGHDARLYPLKTGSANGKAGAKPGGALLFRGPAQEVLLQLLQGEGVTGLEELPQLLRLFITAEAEPGDTDARALGSEFLKLDDRPHALDRFREGKSFWRFGYLDGQHPLGVVTENGVLDGA